MDPVTVIAIASFAIKLFGKSGDATSLIIENQLRILEGLANISTQLQLLSEQISKIEEIILGLPQSIEIFETVVEIKTDLTRLGDEYLVLDAKVRNGTEIDFDATMTDIAARNIDLLGRLRYISSLLENEDGNNSLLYSAMTIDAAIISSISHCLFPGTLFDYLKGKGAVLSNPSLDPKLSLEDVEVQYIGRISDIYKRGEAIVRVQQMNSAEFLNRFTKAKLQSIPEIEAWLNFLNLEIVAILTGSNPQSEKKKMTEFRHEGILRVIRRFDWSGAGGPAGRFLGLYIHQKPFSFNSDGTIDDTPWSKFEGFAGWKKTDEYALQTSGAELWTPQYIDIDGGPGSAAVTFEQIKGVKEALDKLNKDFTGEIPGPFQQINSKIVLGIRAVFYKSALRFAMETRAKELLEVFGRGESNAAIS